MALSLAEGRAYEDVCIGIEGPVSDCACHRPGGPIALGSGPGGPYALVGMADGFGGGPWPIGFGGPGGQTVPMPVTGASGFGTDLALGKRSTPTTEPFANCAARVSLVPTILSMRAGKDVFVYM